MSTPSSEIIAKVQTDIAWDANGQRLEADGIAGPTTKAAVAALFSSDSWPPVAASPVPAPASPTAPTSSQGTPIVGDDSVEPITPEWISRMTQLTGVKPAWIGRYIGPGRPATYQLQKSELAICAQAGIRLLLIAEQTRNVGGTLAEGITDGQGNAKNIFDLFGAEALEKNGESLIVYLDVEGSPSLSSNYWKGWPQGLASEGIALSGGNVTLLAGIYASENDGGTWKALETAMKAGSPCASAWVASYITTSKVPCLPAWDASRARMNTGDSTPPPSCPVDIWQFAGGYEGTPFEALDPDLVNPATDPAAFLARCILP